MTVNNLDLFCTFFKIGLFACGSGYNILPLLEKELITTKKWITNKYFYDIFAIDAILPGSLVSNMASFTGYHIAGFKGLTIATIAVLLPSIIFIYLFSYYLISYHDHKIGQNIIFALMPTILSLLIITIIGVIGELIKRNGKEPFSRNYLKICMFILITFITIYVYNVNPIYIIIRSTSPSSSS